MGIKDYILITPCKDEEESLPQLTESIINQKIKPVFWLIVDDGSADRTPDILQELVSKHNWIKTIRLSEEKRDLGVHFAHVCRIGFNHAINYCLDNNIEYGYVGQIDADVIPEKNYFVSLISEFESNKLLGICSGHIGNIVNGDIVWSNIVEDLPSGGARLWRKECFEDTRGYLLTCSPDSVSNVKAKLKGWDRRQFSYVSAVSSRPYASAGGQWGGYKKFGSNNYFIGYSPLHGLLKGVRLLYSKNGYHKSGIGIAYIVGYFSQYFKRAPQINDKEVLEYYQNERLKEILCSKVFCRRTK